MSFKERIMKNVENSKDSYEKLSEDNRQILNHFYRNNREEEYIKLQNKLNVDLREKEESANRLSKTTGYRN